MAVRRSARREVKPDATSTCGLGEHQQLARTTQFKVCPHCGEDLAPHRQFPIEVPNPDAALGAMMSEDERFITTAAAGIREFLKGFVGFFKTATEIEASAKHTLAEFKAYTEPTDLEGDMVLVSKIRNANSEWDVAKKHWEPVTSLFNNLHKRMTAGRTRALGPLEEAAQIGNRLHNAYGETARRKAREEEERQRREAERVAQEQRDREQAALEEQAIKAEEASEELSAREKTFVDYMAIGNPNPQLAARQAGFKNPAKDAARLMGLVKIVNAIDGQRKARAIRQQAAAQKTAPLEVATVEKVKPEVAGGSRETRSAEIYDVDAFRAAYLDPATRTRLGIPANAFEPSQTVCNQQARSLDEQINRWPGVRLRRDRGVV
jgi:hypothetical protein